MSDFVFYPVTGDGLTHETAYTWNVGTINYNTPADWASVPSFETLSLGTSPTTGTVPNGAAVNAGLIAGDISSALFSLYTPNPADGDPFISAPPYPVDVLLNSGSVELSSLLLAGFNLFPDTPQFPTLDVEGATLDVTGAVVDMGTVTFPTIHTGFPLGDISSATASGGGTIDIGAGGSVALDGAVPNDIIVHFNDSAGNTLEIGASPITNTFAGTITGSVTGNTLLLPDVPLVAGGITTTASFNVTTGILELIVNDPTTIDIAIPNFSTVSGPVDLVASGGGVEVVTCFLRGTRIATPSGQVPIESLRVGDQVLTASGQWEAIKSEPIKWIGHRSLSCDPHPHPEQVWPVRIHAHAFAPNQPQRDLLLSPQHAIFIEDVLIPARCLVNNLNVTIERTSKVEYFHLELSRHDVVLAEGLPTETYLENGDRANFDNGGRPVRLHPDFASLTWENQGYAPLTLAGPELESIRSLLARRAHEPPKLPRPHLSREAGEVGARQRAG